MEIVLRNNQNENKYIDAEEGIIISIQSSGIKQLLINLKDDYNPVYITSNDMYFVGNTVLNELDIYCNSVDILFIERVMECFSLEHNFLNKSISSLSYTEKIYLNIIRNIILSTDIIIFDDIFQFLDYSNQKKIKNLLKYLKSQAYIICVTSRDVNVLYEISDYSIIWNKNTFRFDTTDNIYTDVEMLKKAKLKIPTLPYITYKAKTEKNVKLFYSKDIRDIIKDIYKHV